MKHDYPDIYALAGDVLPSWWDDNGCPRYQEFHPDLSTNIYAQEAALLLIECQECRRKFNVGLFYDVMEDALRSESDSVVPFSEQLESGQVLAYGDPPSHRFGFGANDSPLGKLTKNKCSAGDTMSSITLAVLEFWGTPEWRSNDYARWKRNRELERFFIDSDG